MWQSSSALVAKKAISHLNRRRKKMMVEPLLPRHRPRQRLTPMHHEKLSKPRLRGPRWNAPRRKSVRLRRSESRSRQKKKRDRDKSRSDSSRKR